MPLGHNKTVKENSKNGVKTGEMTVAICMFFFYKKLATKRAFVCVSRLLLESGLFGELLQLERCFEVHTVRYSALG